MFFRKVKMPLFIILLGFFLTVSLLFLTQKNKTNRDIQEVSDPARFSISAGVVPHHLLARDIIEEFFDYISSKEQPETIILLSPDHFHAGDIADNSFITVWPETQEFNGIKIDNALIKNLSLENDFIFSNSGLILDHGITNLIPFVKKYFPDTKIAPFLIPFDLSFEKTNQLAISLNSSTSLKTMVIASCDFSHYLPPQVAEFHDIKSIRTLINFEKEDFDKLDVDSWQALYITRAFAHLRNREFPQIIAHANSVDFSKNENINETTSYFSMVFEKEDLPENSSLSIDFEKVDGRTILFVGDIMLDRGVEYLMRKNSISYPFEEIRQPLRGVDIVFGNLEGPIVKKPQEFPDESLMFAFSSDVVEELSFSNFNLFSLANNHTLNMGRGGLEETKKFLRKGNIDFVGDPIACSQNLSFKKGNIVFLAFNKTFSFNCSDNEIVEIVEKTGDSNSAKFLIVIFHWGEEYQSKSSIFQQKLAHKIIDAGADLIVGSHPHVVQEIEEYKGKLIFYSLGNFIFDQYFSKEAQQGLAVGLEICPKELIFRLFPIQSQLSQPFLMKGEQTKEFLESLAQRSSKNLSNQIKAGIIEIERPAP